VQVVFGLVLPTASLNLRTVAISVLPPVNAALSLAEFARQLRALLSGVAHS